MHILYLHQHFSTPRGATGIRSYEMARRLLHHGHRVTMVCGSYGVGATGLEGPFRKGARRGVIDGIEVIEFDLSYSNRDGFLKRSATFLKYAWGSLRIALTQPYDIAFATTTPLTAGLPAIAARLLRRKPFVFEVRDLWPELPRAMGVITNPLVLGAMSALEWTSYHSADRCIGLAPGITQGIARRGIAESAIATIPNGCDIDIFRSGAEPWRPEGVGSDDLLAIFTGTHGVANGLNAVLDAARILQDRGRDDIKVALVGDGKLKAGLQERADREGLRNLIFHPPVDKAKLAGLMAGADLGLQILANVPAFYYGTSPNKFFDYIAAGRPVLNNYPGWLADILVEEGCGFAVPPDDPAAFADALEQAADGRAALKAMGKRAAALAERRFDRSRLADQWVEWVTEGRRS
ncbi:glycosyltransferase family 4 protein [Sphingopyxis sp. JAI108]|uniref:glycosyltransferase family 4 protein n=1 Tax=Sphingopyxis sp. JAI108 TaxID=2723060 RepID=UPI0015C717CA|nr:glycosyltransferase family 4 protein [Sphingopyxis sp. JAI108]NYF32419.1 glycosyltransferase involved in cell wall biosynthesis [Sphingopyxis sp. JAI108]